MLWLGLVSKTILGGGSLKKRQFNPMLSFHIYIYIHIYIYGKVYYNYIYINKNKKNLIFLRIWEGSPRSNRSPVWFEAPMTPVRLASTQDRDASG